MAPPTADHGNRDDAPTPSRVLLLEDDPVYRETVQAVVPSILPGAEVLVISDHVGFFRALQSGRFDLVITDEEIHWSTGREVLSAVKSLHPAIPVIMLARPDREAAARAALDTGFHAYILTSADLSASLAPTIRSALHVAEYEERVIEHEEKLISQEARLNELLDSLNVAVFRSTVDGRLLEANAALLRMLGVETLEEAQQIDLHTIYAESGTRGKLLEALEEGGQVKDFEVQLKRRDGETVWISLTEKCVVTDDGEAVLEGLAQDVTLQRRASEALEQANDQYRAIFETASAATLVINDDTTINMVNSAFEELTGYKREEVENSKHWTELVAHEDRDRVLKLHRQRRSEPEGIPRSAEFKLIDRNGQVLEVRALESMIPGTPRSVTSILNLTARRRAEEQLLHDAFHDPVTGLPNWHFFLDRLDDLLSALGEDEELAVLEIELDRFREVNHRLGFSVGSKLLRLVGQRLQAELAGVDSIACLGGDSFAMALCPARGITDAYPLASKVRQSLAMPFAFDGRTVACTASIGIALGGRGADPELLLRQAEVAMYAAKEAGRDREAVFEPDMLKG